MTSESFEEIFQLIERDLRDRSPHQEGGVGGGGGLQKLTLKWGGEEFIVDVNWRKNFVYIILCI